MLRTEGNNHCTFLLRCSLSLEHIKRSSCSTASPGLLMTNITLFHTAFSGKTVLLRALSCCPFLKDTLLHRYFQFWTVLLDCVSCLLHNNCPLDVVANILFFKRLL